MNMNNYFYETTPNNQTKLLIQINRNGKRLEDILTKGKY
jgi:hypothetical protein